MKKKTTYTLVGIGIAGVAIAYDMWRKSNQLPLPLAENLDLDKYMGKWYEIARLPAPFERHCFNTQAEYSRNEDGTVNVVNSCTRGSLEGKTSVSQGIAFLDNPSNHAMLKVQFQWPFTGDYQVIDVGKNYEYALVGTPSRKYLWILSRTQELENNILEHLISFAKELGFNTDKLIFTEHKAHKVPQLAVNVEE